MCKKLINLTISILIPLTVGGLSAYLTKDAMSQYGQMIKPDFSPPAIVFPIVWTILYLLMGVSCYIVCSSDHFEKQSALNWYAVQLLLNFIWSIIFFDLQNYLFAFFWLIVLMICIIVMMVKFYKISPISAYLQIPYLLWCFFAAYLNFNIYLLNN
jgi:benzodiazapine receptor